MRLRGFTTASERKDFNDKVTAHRKQHTLERMAMQERLERVRRNANEATMFSVDYTTALDLPHIRPAPMVRCCL